MNKTFPGLCVLEEHLKRVMWAETVTKMVEYMPGMHEALKSISNIVISLQFPSSQGAILPTPPK